MCLVLLLCVSYMVILVIALDNNFSRLSKLESSKPLKDMDILLSIKWKTNPLCIQIALFHLPKHPPVPVCLDSDFLLYQKLQY